MDFQKRVIEYIEQNNMIDFNDEVILGLSGGADSVALFFVLLEYRKIFAGKHNRKLPMRCVYVHHMIREDADRDVELVTKLCEEAGIPLSVEKCDVTALAKAESQTVEEAGRKVRYEIFQRFASLCGEGGNRGRIAVAHHMDDQAETVLFNMVRGTGISGLRGMHPVSKDIIRPLLCVTKKQILEYVEGIGAEYVTDSTNSDVTYSRNRLRNEIIPALRLINDKAVQHIASAAEKLSLAEDYLMRGVERRFTDIAEVRNYRGAPEYYLPAGDFEDTDPAIKDLLIWKMLAECAGSAKDISEIHIKNVSDLMGGETGRSVNLPYGMNAYRVSDGLVLRGSGAGNTVQEPIFSVKVADIGDVPEISGDEEGNIKVSKKECTKFFDYDKINGCVHMRKVEASDEMVIDSQGHRKRVNRIFIDMKIPAYRREDCFAICDEENILWIPGVRDAYVCRVDENTKRVAVISVDMRD